MRHRNLLAPIVRLEDLMSNLVRAASFVVAALAVAACATGSASPPSVASPVVSMPASTPAASAASSAPAASPVPSVAASAAASPTSFTSQTYGYSLTVPGGWKVVQATATWDGMGAPFHDVPEADQFIGPKAASAWFFGAPTTKDLAGKVKESIAANAGEHSNTCPVVPDVNDPIKIGGEPGVLLGYNCGILINSGITVHKGRAYLFGFRDPAVHAANDAADRAAFLELLASVKFPD